MWVVVLLLFLLLPLPLRLRGRSRRAERESCWSLWFIWGKEKVPGVFSHSLTWPLQARSSIPVSAPNIFYEEWPRLSFTARIERPSSF
jgi:hypothetical protein